MLHITRFEYGRTRGWFVRFERGPASVRKLFSDNKFGGKQNALVEANER